MHHNQGLHLCNSVLDKFELTNLPPAPCGFPQIKVTFDVDANGIFSAFAVDKSTGKKEQDYNHYPQEPLKQRIQGTWSKKLRSTKLKMKTSWTPSYILCQHKM